MNSRAGALLDAARTALRAEMSAKLVALVIASLCGCAQQQISPRSLPDLRPNLGIAEDADSYRPAISQHEIRVRNRSSVAGDGVISVSIVDSVGVVMSELFLANGTPVRIPSETTGGGQGLTVPIVSKPFARLLDSLNQSEAVYGIRATITTTGGDVDESDNSRTLQSGGWYRILAGRDAEIRFELTVPMFDNQKLAARLDVLPNESARMLQSGTAGLFDLRPGQRQHLVRLLVPDDFEHGSSIRVRLSLFDVAMGSAVQQQERYAIFDTIAPVLDSYRMILFKDGRLSIQVRAVDEHTDIPENGVVTEISIDGGKSWHRRVHRAVEDDFGRPALFEMTTGPFAPGTALLIGVRARDVAGNTSSLLPSDAGVFVAPLDAERAFDAVDTLAATRVDGNIVFALAAAVRAARLVASASAPSEVVSAKLARRLQEVEDLLAPFEALKVDFGGFSQIKAPVERLRLANGTELTILRIPAWR